MTVKSYEITETIDSKGISLEYEYGDYVTYSDYEDLVYEFDAYKLKAKEYLEEHRKKNIDKLLNLIDIE